MYAIIGGLTLPLVKGSPVVDQKIEERSTATFVREDLVGAETYQRGQPVALYDDDDTLIFGGFIADPALRRLSPSGGIRHTIISMDNHYLADKRLAIGSYTATKAGDIVTALHTNYLDAEGVTLETIQDGPELVQVDFNYVKVSEALDGLAELAGFTWFIDEQKRLFFIDRTTNVTDWNWSVTTPKPPNSYPTLSSGNPKYRNVQYVRGGTGLTGEQEDHFIADGVAGVGTVAFTVGYPIGTVPIVTVDGIGQDVGILGIDTGEDCYWNKGSPIITFETAPDAPDPIIVTYFGQYPLISVSSSETERVARQAIEGGGTGLVESIIDEAYHESGASSLQSARAKITDYARDAARFTYPTTQSGIRPGQLQTVNYPLLGLNNEQMLIESVLMTSEGGLPRYDITAIVGPVEGHWTKFFSTMLHRQTLILRIGDVSLLGLIAESEALALAESPSSWQQLKGQYCWAPKTNGAGLREAYWDMFTYG